MILRRAHCFGAAGWTAAAWLVAFLWFVGCASSATVQLSSLDDVIECGAALDGQLLSNASQVLLDICIQSSLCKYQHGQDSATDPELFAAVWAAATTLEPPWTTTSALRDAICGRTVREAWANIALLRMEADVVRNNVYKLSHVPRQRESDGEIVFVPIATLNKPETTNVNLFITAGFVILLEFFIIVMLVVHRIRTAEIARLQVMTTPLPTFRPSAGGRKKK